MASPGGLTQIFKKPLPENLTLIECLSPAYQIRRPPALPVTPALEFFGELNFFTKKTEPPSPSPCPPTPPCNVEEQEQVCTTKNLQKFRSFESICTEGLGFESTCNLDEDSVVSRDGESQSCNRYLRSQSDVSSRSREAFPPPISCIAKSGKPWMLLKPYRKDGMLVLKEIRIARELHSTREDGRLRMHFLQPDEKDGGGGGEEEQGHDKQEKVDDDQKKKQTGLLNMKKRKMPRSEGHVDGNSDENYLSSIKDQYTGIRQTVP